MLIVCFILQPLGGLWTTTDRAATFHHYKSRRKSRLNNCFSFLVLIIYFSSHGMTRIVFCKATLQGYKKRRLLSQQWNIRKPWSRKNWGNAIFYWLCDRILCQCFFLSFGTFFCFWFNRHTRNKDRKICMISYSSVLVYFNQNYIVG